MKKLVLTMFIAVCATALFAQDQTPPAAATSPAPAATAKPARKHPEPTVTHKLAVKNFCCPAGDYVSAKPGVCPNDKKTLVRDGMYYCEDGTTSRVPAKCKDGKDMVKMVDYSKKTDNTKAAPSAK